MKDLSDDDMKWLKRIMRDVTPVGHCGESSGEAIHRERVEARVDRILASLTGEGEPVAWRCEVNGSVAWFEDRHDVTTATKDFANVLVQPLYTRPVACPDREAVARIIDPVAMITQHVFSSDGYPNVEKNNALAKADAIIAMLTRGTDDA